MTLPYSCESLDSSCLLEKEFLKGQRLEWTCAAVKSIVALGHLSDSSDCSKRQCDYQVFIVVFTD